MQLLPSYNTDILELSLMQSRWAAILNPVLSTPLIDGVAVKNVSVVSGSNQVVTKLGRAYQGYLITGMRGAFVQVYEGTSTNTSQFLNLISNGSATLDLWVY